MFKCASGLRSLKVEGDRIRDSVFYALHSHDLVSVNSRLRRDLAKTLLALFDIARKTIQYEKQFVGKILDDYYSVLLRTSILRSFRTLKLCQVVTTALGPEGFLHHVTEENEEVQDTFASKCIVQRSWVVGKLEHLVSFWSSLSLYGTGNIKQGNLIYKRPNCI